MSPRMRKEGTVNQGPAPDPDDAIKAALATFNEDWAELNLAGKISRISGHLGRIPKNGWNSFNSYPYVLESDLVEAIRYFLAAADILIYPSVVDWRVTDGLGKSGDSRTDVLYEFRIVDGKSGETFSFNQLGQGSDPRDKGSNKASTSAMKFAYLRLFNIASGEDAEGDVVGDQRAALGSQDQIPVSVTPSSVEGAQSPGSAESRRYRRKCSPSAVSRCFPRVFGVFRFRIAATGLVGVIEKVLGDKIELPEEEPKQGPVLAAYLKDQKGEDVGKLIYALQEMVKTTGVAVEAEDVA